MKHTPDYEWEVESVSCEHCVKEIDLYAGYEGKDHCTMTDEEGTFCVCAKCHTKKYEAKVEEQEVLKEVA